MPPFGEQRVKNRVAALSAQIADFKTAQAPLVAPAGPALVGLDPLALVRALGLATSSAIAETASGLAEELGSSSDSGSDESESSKALAPSSWIRSQMGGVPSSSSQQAKPAAKAAAAPPIPKMSGSDSGKTRRTGHVGASPRSPPSALSRVPTAGSAQTSAPPAPEMELCDGRNARCLQALQPAYDNALATIKTAQRFLMTDPPACFTRVESFAHPRSEVRRCLAESLKHEGRREGPEKQHCQDR